MNLQLLKGVIMKPEVKQVLKEQDLFKDGPEEIPISLEEHLLRQKIRLEREHEEQKAKLEEQRHIREMERQIMVNSMVPEKSTIHS